MAFKKVIQVVQIGGWGGEGGGGGGNLDKIQKNSNFFRETIPKGERSSSWVTN